RATHWSFKPEPVHSGNPLGVSRMQRCLPVLSTVLALWTGSAVAQAPDADVYLAALRVSGGQVSLGPLRNITQRAGYDNQPFFTRDSKGILYTARIDDKQTDIFRYDLQSQRTERVTNTPEGEYSATPLPGGGFSVIRVEPDSAQRLWRFDDAGSNPTL